tara:strand:+ start:534 stop:998 length:465 start_codon:yes stop_codon:yes gene_type:complete
MQDFKFDLVVVNSSDLDLLNQIQELEKMAFAEGGEDYWTLRPMAEQQLILAAVSQNTVYAHAILWKQWSNSKIAYLHSFVVDSCKQGIGLGRSFFSQIKRYLVKLQFETLQLTIEDSNEAAKKIYSSETVLIEKRFIKNAYGPGEDRWHWTLGI